MILEQEQIQGQFAQQIILERQEQAQATNVDLHYYQHQGTFLLRTAALRSFWKKFTDYVVVHPGVVPTLLVVGESGGSAKSHTGAEATARLNYGKRLIQRVHDSNGDLLEARFSSLTTVGLDLMGELDERGERRVKNIPAEWSDQEKPIIKARWHDTISGMRERGPEVFPGRRLVHVAEGVYTLMGDPPIDEHTFVIFRTTTPEPQKGAARERATYKNPDSKPADVYKSSGGGIDDTEVSGSELALWMGNEASMLVGREIVNGILLENERLLAERGVPRFDRRRLESDPDFRNQEALAELYEMTAERWGVAEGQSIVTPNFFETGKTRRRKLHHKVLRTFRVNSRLVVDPSTVGYVQEAA